MKHFFAIVLFLALTWTVAVRANGAEETSLEVIRGLYPAAVAPVETSFDWALSAKGQGKKEGDTLELTGNRDSSQWSSSPFPVQERKLYQFRMKASCATTGSGDCAPAGFDFANHDYRGLPNGSIPKEIPPFVALVPDGYKTGRLRAAQWETTRTYLFSDITVTSVFPIFQGIKSAQNASRDFSGTGDWLLLGDGESIQEGVYRFNTFTNSIAGNYSRPLVSARCSFNTDRWCLGTGSEVVYCFQLQPLHFDAAMNNLAAEPLQFKEATISVAIGYYMGGSCILEGSLDGVNWKELKRHTGSGGMTVTVTAETFGQTNSMSQIWLRASAIEHEGKGANLQIGSIGMEAPIDSNQYSGRGKTVFAEVGGSSDQATNASTLAFETIPLFLTPLGRFYYLLANRGTAFDWNPLPTVLLAGDKKSTSSEDWDLISLNGSSRVATNSLTLFSQRFKEMNSDKEYTFSYPFEKTFTYRIAVPPYLTQNYTAGIAGITGKAENIRVSWCEADYKIPKTPETVAIKEATPIRIEAAANDYESFQIVIQPDDESSSGLTGLSATVSELSDGKGNVIAAGHVEFRYAYYHFVTVPTDSTSMVAWWPDALVPLDKGADGRGAPLSVSPGCNQPLWVTVHIPLGTKSGLYSGQVVLKDSSASLAVMVPFELKVWDFSLPVTNRLETAFGLSAGMINRYHNCKTEEDRRAVFELYLKNFSEHRISPYDWAPYDHFSLKWRSDTNPPSAELDTSRFTNEMKRIVEKYHFTNFRLPVQGMGGGTYEGRNPPKIGLFDEHTPEYKAMFADFVGKLQTDLENADLLKGAYVYWFDEPDLKDYEFVVDGFARLKKYAPKLQRMLTEEPSPDFCHLLEEKQGELDIWCPVSYNFDEESAQKQMAKGERFWWYVCCGPKAPYCTLFIDHPATELRIWHWQTWQYQLKGTLVWESSYWTSPAAFPDKAQNPYLDPMGYVSSGPRGSKQYWGNGDGRFVYPPLAAAEPGLNDGKPIIEAPVSSIRWEMIREGVQDYEMLQTLADLADKHKAQLTSVQKEELEDIFRFDAITTSLKEFSTVPQPIYKKRRAIARMIETLQ